jgi:hypothetical protein
MTGPPLQRCKLLHLFGKQAWDADAAEAQQGSIAGQLAVAAQRPALTRAACEMLMSVPAEHLLFEQPVYNRRRRHRHRHRARGAPLCFASLRQDGTLDTPFLELLLRDLEAHVCTDGSPLPALREAIAPCIYVLRGAALASSRARNYLRRRVRDGSMGSALSAAAPHAIAARRRSHPASTSG